MKLTVDTNPDLVYLAIVNKEICPDEFHDWIRTRSGLNYSEGFLEGAEEGYEQGYECGFTMAQQREGIP